MNTPEGWKLVPVEPTQEMLRAAVYNTDRDCEGDWSATAGNWSAMLAAAPTPPEQPAARGGLTDERINCLWLFRKNLHDGSLMPQLRDFARAVIAAHDAARKRPAAQCEGYLSGVNVEALLRACAELGLSAEHSLEALAAPDVLAEHINRVSRAVIAAARKRPEAEVAEIMEAADAYRWSGCQETRAHLERLVRGDKS